MTEWEIVSIGDYVSDFILTAHSTRVYIDHNLIQVIEIKQCSGILRFKGTIHCRVLFISKQEDITPNRFFFSTIPQIRFERK